MMDNKTPSLPTESSSDKGGSDKEVAKRLIEGIEKTQIETLRKAPAQHAGIIQITLIVAVVSVLLGAYLIYKDQPYLGGGAIVVCVVALGVAMFFIRPQGSPTLDRMVPPKTEPDKASTIQWSRVTIKLPIPHQRLNKLSGMLRQIRKEAKTKYGDLLAARNLPADRIIADRVRINVFLPDTKDAIYGEVCGLHIPEGLHDGMGNETERLVRFRPNEGLTGHVFKTEKVFGALRESATSKWQPIHLEGLGGKADEEFQLTLKQVRLIDSELRWIVSFPLKVTLDNLAQTFGVLNVDGLTELLTPEEMQSIYHTLRDTVDQFARDVFEVDKCRITITVEDINATSAA